MFTLETESEKILVHKLTNTTILVLIPRKNEFWELQKIWGKMFLVIFHCGLAENRLLDSTAITSKMSFLKVFV